MKYNPITNELLTDKGILIKKLLCPISQQWQDMEEGLNQHRLCNHCTHIIYDTAHITEEEAKELVGKTLYKENN